jgi:hypothetical protein
MVYSPEELDRIVKGIAGIEDQTQDTTDTMAEMLKQFARNAQDALGDTVESTLRGNFDSIGQLWGNLLLKMASQAIAAQLGQTLFGDFAKDGVFGGLVGKAIGWVMSPGKASGGPVGAYSLQRVNERGFEVFTTKGQDYLMTGASGGKVTPNSALGGGRSGAPGIVNNIQVAAGMGRGEVLAAIQIAMRSVEASIHNSLRAQRVIA